MHIPDVINSSYEVLGFVAVGLSCLRVMKDKKVAGVSLITVGFFTSWGFWNLYYYSHLNQPFSTLGAGFTCIANVVWCTLLVKYRKAV